MQFNSLIIEKQKTEKLRRNSIGFIRSFFLYS